jgi:ketosteroid isomerase-like protein
MADGTVFGETNDALAQAGTGLKIEVVTKPDKDPVAENLACVELHFHTEAANEIEAALELYTDDVVWEAPAPNGLNRSFSGKEAVAESYRELFGSVGNVRFQPLQRFATETRVVDDSLITFEVVKDGYWPHFSAGQKIEMRLVHIFEMRDGKISKEIVFDMGRPVLTQNTFG